jgi:uncharacterized membrane protein
MNVATVILVVGCVWGSAAFILGLVAGFTIGPNDFVASLVGVFFGFLCILPITTAAIWKPAPAAIALIGCFCVAICSVLLTGDILGAAKIGLVLAVPNGILITGYFYVASVRRKRYDEIDRGSPL